MPQPKDYSDKTDPLFRQLISDDEAQERRVSRPKFLEKFSIPLGSLAVDVTLVVGIVWWGATQTATLQVVAQGQSRTDAQVQELSRQTTVAQNSQRIAVLETTVEERDRQFQGMREEIVKRLDRIESKLDRQ